MGIIIDQTELGRAYEPLTIIAPGQIWQSKAHPLMTLLIEQFNFNGLFIRILTTPDGTDYYSSMYSMDASDLRERWNYKDQLSPSGVPLSWMQEAIKY